jgi:hypothetical protein
MHQSRLSTIVIDCNAATFERDGAGAPYVLLQKVPAEERSVHLDIETDDVEAEVRRLEGLGARVKARIREHVVMLAPSGHAFCVVPTHRPDFPEKAATWSD